MSEESELCGPETEEMLPIRPLQHKSHFAALSHQVADIQFPLRRRISLVNGEQRMGFQKKCTA